jgi:prepilin-type N-terminal cleavage/methylation domain-containing protein
MMKSRPLQFSTPCAAFDSRKSGFTLIEVMLVVVIALIMLSVSVPHFARTYKGSRLRSAARTINRMTRYARNMAIMRETRMTVVINRESREIYLGGMAQVSTNAADGELDQDVLKRLGYIEGETAADLNIDKEIHRYLPEGIEVDDFEKDWREDDPLFEDIYFFNCYADGQVDWFFLRLQDRSGLAVEMENDPISGTVRSEFAQ